jgi:hypothetical protein
MKAKNLLKMAVAAFLISGMGASNAMAANNANGTANANVITPISIVNDGIPLNFASALPGETIVVTPGGVGSGSSLSSPGTYTATTFAVTGANGQTYTAGIPANVVMSPVMVNDVVLNCTVDNAGVVPETISCGGSLLIDASDAVGAHTGTFNVTANYP